MRLESFALAATTAIVAAPVATADPGDWYATGGYAWLGGDFGTNSYDVNAVVLRGGYEWTNNLGVEVEAGVGVEDQIIRGAGDPPIENRIGLNQYFGAFGVGRVQTTEFSDFFVRAGVVQYEVESEVSRFTFTEDDIGVAGSAGVDLHFGQRHGLRLSASIYSLEETVEAFELAYKYRF
ncbi:MAG: porin family protein [Pseudomonadota bacterium]